MEEFAFDASCVHTRGHVTKERMRMVRGERYNRKKIMVAKESKEEEAQRNRETERRVTLVDGMNDVVATRRKTRVSPNLAKVIPLAKRGETRIRMCVYVQGRIISDHVPFAYREETRWTRYASFSRVNSTEIL